MKVQLIVVQGKPEGKIIPLITSPFKIGRGEACNLRPNSEQVSREHCEFSYDDQGVYVRDLKSRNGCFLNGKRVPTDTPQALKDGDLVQVGPLTFAMSIQGVIATAAKPKASTTADIDKVPDDDIESWLVADQAHATPASGSGVYGGDTMSFTSFKAIESPPVSTGGTAEVEQEAAPEPESADEDGAEQVEETPAEWVDESNPFYQKKAAEAEKPDKQSYKDSADAASDILRRMMERRRASR